MYIRAALATALASFFLLTTNAPAQSIPLPPIPTSQPPMPAPDQLPSLNAMPDPLTFNNGSKVTTPDQWKTRREEIKQILQYYSTGQMPPPPGNVKGVQLKSQSVLDGKVNYRLIHLSFGPNESLGFDVAIYTPAGKGPFPVFINPSLIVTPGALPLPLMPHPKEQGKADALALPLPSEKPADPPPLIPSSLPDPDTNAHSFAEVFRHGYALIIYHYEDAGEDNVARNPDGSWAMRNTRFFPAYPQYDWGLVSAWAWGISRVVDYVDTDPLLDKSHITAIGHSRLGKALLVAAAFDDRITVAAPAGSGTAGNGAFRFNGPGTSSYHPDTGFDDLLKKFPNWFSPHLRPFVGHSDKLPFDQNFFLALIAPRGIISAEGTTDDTCVPNATRQTYLATRPVFQLLNAPDHLGISYTPHAHALTPADWSAALDFTDQQFRHLPITRKFNEFPPDVPIVPTPTH